MAINGISCAPLRTAVALCCGGQWGATEFRCRQAWGRRVAYSSQFLDPDNRAHRGKAKIKARPIGDFDPDEWELPPQPKWLRWHTYNRLRRTDTNSVRRDFRSRDSRVDGQIAGKNNVDEINAPKPVTQEISIRMTSRQPDDAVANPSARVFAMACVLMWKGTVTVRILWPRPPLHQSGLTS